VTNSDLKITGLNVRDDAPGIGEVKFDWKGGLTVSEKDVPLSGYPRFDNPYQKFSSEAIYYDIKYHKMELLLDFQNGIREIK